jgi:hypothetical protein
MTDFDKKITITENTQDYLLTLVNDCPYGMGLRIKAGEARRNTTKTSTNSSVAILSVADKHNDNKFIVKSNGDVVSYYNHTIGDIFIEKNIIGTVSSEPIELTEPVLLRRYTKNKLPKLSHEYAGSVVSIDDENFKPAYYDGTDWRYFSNDEIVK